MGGNSLAIGASEADINQSICIQQMLERRECIQTVIIPL